MAYMKDNEVWKTVDWWTIVLYLVLIFCGWVSVCGASYDYGEPDFLDFSSRAGRQLMWMGCSLGLGFILLMLEDRLYDTYAYLIYGILLVLLFGTIFNPHEIKGSRSWIVLGPVSLQPAEFAKFATALALSKFMGEYTFNISHYRHMLMCLALFMVPMALIICQKETGSALVYLSFFLMLYREGMTGSILFAGICMIIYFIVGIRFSADLMSDGSTSWGEFSVLALILLFSAALVYAYCNNRQAVRHLLVIGGGLMLLSMLFSLYVIPFDVTVVQAGVCIAMALYLVYLFLRERLVNYLYIVLFAIGSVGFFQSADYVFNEVLEPHQQIRIKVLLGMEDDPTGAGYNVNQSKIAIGSGGFLGKGFLNGTQTKLKYVPEQETDFIFCTVGEEHGFVGASVVICLFAVLILRLLVLAERQTSRFGRVYGYSVLSIFFFHLFVNIGMVLGITPVIGIPLPFFSYGGSSLWGFTILLFVFLRIDAGRES
ncbi:MAG: rod shape-determining protein RodA [Phocaeicola plebeius]